MSFGPHKQSIEPGDSARKAEQEPRPVQLRRIDGGTAAREAEQSRETSIGRTVHGFTLSARIGKPFRFEDGTPRTAGEAMPDNTGLVASDIEIKKTTHSQLPKLANETAVQKEQADDKPTDSIAAFSGSWLRALFRRHVSPELPGNDES